MRGPLSPLRPEFNSNVRGSVIGVPRRMFARSQRGVPEAAAEPQHIAARVG